MMKGASSIVTIVKVWFSIVKDVSTGTVVFPEGQSISFFSSITSPSTSLHVPTFSKPNERRFTMSNIALTGDRFVLKFKGPITPEELTFEMYFNKVSPTGLKAFKPLPLWALNCKPSLLVMLYPSVSIWWIACASTNTESNVWPTVASLSRRLVSYPLLFHILSKLLCSLPCPKECLTPTIPWRYCGICPSLSKSPSNAKAPFVTNQTHPSVMPRSLACRSITETCPAMQFNTTILAPRLLMWSSCVVAFTKDRFLCSWKLSTATNVHPLWEAMSLKTTSPFNP